MPFDITSGDEDGDQRPDAVKFLCAQLFRKELIKPPSIYVEGNDIKIHLRKVEEYIQFTGISSEEEKVYILLESLHDELQKEVRMSRDFQANKNDFSFVNGLVSQLYHTKKAPISAFLQLLQLTQKKGQSVVEFAREIRIRAFDCIYDLTPDEREKYMLECFLNGLRSNVLKTALTYIKPKSLEEAVKMIKKEEKKMDKNQCETVDIVNCSSGCQAQIEALKKEISFLKQEMTNLRNSQGHGRLQERNSRLPTLQGVRQVPQFGRALQRRPNGPYNKTSRIVCYNCKRPGHYAATCRLPRKCFNCGQGGHISRFCKQVNQLVTNDICSTASNIDDESGKTERFQAHAQQYDEDFPVLSVSNRYTDLPDEGQYIHAEEEEEVCVTECNLLPQIKQRQMGKRVRLIESKSREGQGCSSLIEKQVAFIEGKGPNPIQQRPVCKPSLLNKPVVKCRVNGDQMNTLMDSGATCNLIAKEVFDVLKEKDGCELLKTRSRISCANNSCMKCHGEVGLHLSLAGKTTVVKFFVVEGLNTSQVIIGLRTMKRLGMKFDFEKDCVIINNIVVPFEASVIPSTTVHNAGN